MNLKVDFNKIIDKRVKKKFKKLRSQKLMSKFGQFAAELIVRRTRLGKGVNRDGGKETTLKPLKDSTVKQRMVAKSRTTMVRRQRTKLPKLSDKTGPKRSNLTWTGQMLDDITIVAQSMGRILLGFLTDRSEDIAKYHEEGGGKLPKRQFFHLSGKDRSKLTNYIRRSLEKLR